MKKKEGRMILIHDSNKTLKTPQSPEKSRSPQSPENSESHSAQRTPGTQTEVNEVEDNPPKAKPKPGTQTPPRVISTLEHRLRPPSPQTTYALLHIFEQHKRNPPPPFLLPPPTRQADTGTC